MEVKVLFRWLITTLLVCQLAGLQLIAAAQLNPSKQSADVHLYMPYVVNDPPLQIVLLSISNPQPSLGFVISGYVLNRTKKPFYGVQVHLMLSATTFNPPSSQPYGATEIMVFPASLPGQPNPFGFQLRHASPDTVTVESAEIIQALDKSPNDPTYVALNASDWVSANSRITGTVRNETAFTVRDARVFVMISGTTDCYTAPGGFLVTTTLQPGESQPYYAIGCDPMIAFPVAQGRVSP